MLKCGLLNWNLALERAGVWFLRSGIQEPEGGVARYYRSDISRNATVSTEITGYSLHFLIYAHRRTGRADFLAAATRAARFLTRHGWSAEFGLFPFEHSFQGEQPQALAYFFDSGIIIRGLLAAWRVTGEAEFLDTAVAAGRGMQRRFPHGAGLAPILRLPPCEPVPYEPRWSASPGCYQLKSAMAWHNLFQVTGDAAFEASYRGVLSYALASNDSFLPGDANPDRVMDRLHAYSYFLEGMLPCAGEPACCEAMRVGIERTGRHLREIAPQFARADVYAQLLRARLFADALGMVRLDVDAARHEAEEAAKFQFASSEARFDGGFGFGCKRGQSMPFVNPVSTAFCAQTLDLWSEYRAGRFVPDVDALV